MIIGNVDWRPRFIDDEARRALAARRWVIIGSFASVGKEKTWLVCRGIRFTYRHPDRVLFARDYIYRSALRLRFELTNCWLLRVLNSDSVTFPLGTTSMLGPTCPVSTGYVQAPKRIIHLAKWKINETKRKETTSTRGVGVTTVAVATAEVSSGRRRTR